MEKVDIYSMTVTGEAEEGPGGYGTILRWKDREGKFHQKTMAQGQTYTDQLSLSLEGLIAGLIELGVPVKWIYTQIRSLSTMPFA